MSEHESSKVDLLNRPDDALKRTAAFLSGRTPGWQVTYNLTPCCNLVAVRANRRSLQKAAGKSVGGTKCTLLSENIMILDIVKLLSSK